MSLSRAELEAMDRDELVETVIEMDQDVQRLDALVTALQTQKTELERAIVGERSGHQSFADVEPETPVVEQLTELAERVAELEGSVKTHTGNEAYEEMDRDDRVFEIRVALAKKAAESSGTAAYAYDNVTSLFNEKPSDGYAYKLMKLAAGYDADREASTKDGYEYTTNPEGHTQLRCSIGAVNDEAVLHAVNNRMEDGGG